MWILTGPFDGETSGETNFQRSKLLKPNTSYMLGRRRQPLTVNHKNIHSEHFSFTVGEYTEDDAGNPDAIPDLEVRNMGTKQRRVIRGEVSLQLDPGASCELQDGDIVYLLNGITLSVRWEKMCCFSSLPQSQFKAPIKECSQLGISIVVTPHVSVTHHLISNYTLKPAVAASLLSLACFVKPDWLTTLLSLGEAVDGQSSLERSYNLPRVSEFRPDYSPSIPSTLRLIRTWEPNEARLNMLTAYRVIFAGEKSRECSSDDKELVKRGGGEYECFAVNGGRKAFHSILAKGVAKGKALVLVADEHAMGTAIGQDNWMEFVREAAEYRLKFIRPEKLVSAVLHADVTFVDCMLAGSDEDAHRFASPLPDVVPNTHADEPSYPQSAALGGSDARPPRRQLRRRAGSSAPEAAPTMTTEQPTNTNLPTTQGSSGQGIASAEQEKEPEQPLPPRRRPLKRRVPTPTPTIIGIDDPSAVLDVDTVMGGVTDAPNTAGLTQSTKEAPVAPTPARARLKRRLNTDEPKFSFNLDTWGPSQKDPEEPSHKRWKDLFDESNPDKIAQLGMEEYKAMFNDKQSLTQSEAEMHAQGASKLSGLDAVPEEEEESAGVGTGASVAPSQSAHTQESSRGQKRKAGHEDVEMDDDKHARSKRRTVEPQEPIVAKKNAGPTQANGKSNKLKVTINKAEKGEGAELDKDEAFLKAVASTKRGKKKEDDFDREFNDLRISKPDLRKEDAVNQWAVLEEFGDDGDVRGNFMVVVEMEIFKKDSRGDQTVYRRGEGRLDWEGRPDFKKFKKRATGERKPIVELVVEEEPEFTFGSRLRIGGAQLQDSNGETQKRKGRRMPVAPVDSDDDDTVLPLVTRRNTKGAQGAGPSDKANPPAVTAPKQSQKRGAQALFIESDEESTTQPSQAPANEHGEDSEVPKRKPPSRTNRRKPVVDDDSDDGLTFKGFGSRRRK